MSSSVGQPQEVQNAKRLKASESIKTYPNIKVAFGMLVVTKGARQLPNTNVYPKMSSFSLHLATAISLDNFRGSNLTFDFGCLCRLCKWHLNS